MKIEGDLTKSVETEDDIIVTGNVIEGGVIKTKGNIVVNGSVGNVSLEAGKDIIIKNGISGQGKAKIYAHGNIITKFAEKATLDAGKNVIATTGIVECIIDSGDKVIVLGKKGVIRGGIIRANKEVWAKEIGSMIETPTEINVGMRFSKGMVIGFKIIYPGVKIVTPFITRKLDREFYTVGFIITEENVEAWPLDSILRLRKVEPPPRCLELQEYKSLMEKLLELEIENLLKLNILNLAEIRNLFWDS